MIICISGFLYLWTIHHSNSIQKGILLCRRLYILGIGIHTQGRRNRVGSSGSSLLNILGKLLHWEEKNWAERKNSYYVHNFFFCLLTQSKIRSDAPVHKHRYIRVDTALESLFLQKSYCSPKIFQTLQEITYSFFKSPHSFTFTLYWSRVQKSFIQNFFKSS